MRKYINRFGEVAKQKPKDINFDYQLGDIVLSASKGLCLIDGFGIYANQYWVENGAFSQSGYINDIARKADNGEASEFMKKYLPLFKAHVERFYPKDKEPKYYREHMRHCKSVEQLKSTQP